MSGNEQEAPEKRFYKITHQIEITAYVQARSPRVALAINYQDSYHQHSYGAFWDGRMRTTSETIEQVEQIPEELDLADLMPKEIPCPCVRAIVTENGNPIKIWIPVKHVEEDGLKSSANFMCGKSVEVIACDLDTYYLYEKDEIWKPISEGGEL